MDLAKIVFPIDSAEVIVVLVLTYFEVGESPLSVKKTLKGPFSIILFEMIQC